SLAFEHAPREREIVLDGAACTVARYRAKRPRPADLDDARRRRDDDREQRTREFEELALAFEVVRLLRFGRFERCRGLHRCVVAIGNALAAVFRADDRSPFPVTTAAQ